MNQPPLNPDAVDRVAKALMDDAGYTWGNATEKFRDGFRHHARIALAAALPEVTSVEELDQLPMHTYVQGADGFKHAKDWNGGWHLIVNRPSSAPHLSGSIELPARVLYRPEVKP